MELPPSPEGCASIDKEVQTVEIVDDSATVESVTLPPEDKDDDDEPEPQHVAIRSFSIRQKIEDCVFDKWRMFQQTFSK
jgi:hypothetical protein